MEEPTENSSGVQRIAGGVDDPASVGAVNFNLDRISEAIEGVIKRLDTIERQIAQSGSADPIGDDKAAPG